MKLCNDCKEDLPFDAFSKNSKSADGLQYYCKRCAAVRKKEYYEANKEEINRKTVEKRRSEPEARQKKKEAQKKWQVNNPEKYKEIWQRTNKQYRMKVLGIVGKGDLRCVRCGCDQPELLEINHINGGGAKEVKHRNQEFYGKITRGEREVDDLELLCKPCNNLHYLELKYGSLPFKITWEAKDGQGSDLQ